MIRGGCFHTPASTDWRRTGSGGRIAHILVNSIFNRDAGEPAPERVYWSSVP